MQIYGWPDTFFILVEIDPFTVETFSGLVQLIKTLMERG